MENIYDLANALERGIRDLPEYKTLVAKKAEIDQDAQAKALFEEFTSLQESLLAAMQSGQMPSQDQQETLTALGTKIEANSLVKSYLEAQQAISVYLTDIERIVFGPLRELTD